MIPLEKVQQIVSTYETLEKELASGDINKKDFANKSKEYSSISEVINEARNYLSFNKEKEELEKGHADMCEDMFEHIAEENPHVVSDVLQEVFEEKPRLKTWYKSDKTPLDNYKRMMLKPFVNKKLRDKFPDIFTAIDQEYHQKIAAVDKKITALKSEN